jgi:hypothetical protein
LGDRLRHALADRPRTVQVGSSAVFLPYFPHISFVISLNFGLVSRIYGPDFEGQANSARPLDSPFLTRTLVILGQHRDRSGLAEEDQPVVLRDRTLARE